MPKRIVPILALLASLALPSVAGAHTVLVGPHADAYRQLIARSLLPTPSLRVRLIVDPAMRTCNVRPGSDVGACMSWTGEWRRHYFIVMHTARPSPVDAIFFMHEIGHVEDWALMTEAQRNAFKVVFHQPGSWRDWKIGEPWDPAWTGMETFGEVYATCALGEQNNPNMGNWITFPNGESDGAALPLACSMMSALRYSGK